MALTKAKLIELFDSGQLDDYMGGGALGNITADGKVGTVADLTLMTGTDGLVVARTMAEAIAIWKFTNQNLLHNADFRNPVNQRGVSGTISATGYFYDRWILNSGTVTINANYLTISAGGEIEQRIEGNLMSGKVATVSVMVGGTVYSGTGTMPTSAGTVTVALTGFGTATLGYATGYMYVRLSPTAASNLQMVKLELGTVSTLAYDPPMEYGTELVKCQRYYVQYDTINRNPYTIYGDTLYFYNECPSVMRIVPTIAVISGNVAVHPFVVQSGFTFAGAAGGPNKYYITATKTGHGLSAWSCYGGFVVAISADL